jgi:ParB-like chromosome segregation protein Spo0J
MVSDILGMIDFIKDMPLDEKIAAINTIRRKLHDISPFKSCPVDFVEWVKNENVHANDYNPNSVAPPEMKLLERSIEADGYTQPIVTWPNNGYEVVDGFHRHRVGKESEIVKKMVMGYLPVVSLSIDRHERNDRMAATIRHNRARGKHSVSAMSEIVVELKRRFWSDEKIAKELGMEPDEVLRLQQIKGLAFAFKDYDFSESWEAESFNDISEDEFEGEEIIENK